MKTYWDHDKKERAALAADDVRRLLDFELMQKGVLKVVAPVLEEVAEVAVPKRKAFGIQYGSHESLDILFATAADAEAFLGLRPLVRVNDWQTSTTYSRPLADVSIAQIDIATEPDVVNARSVLLENRAKKERNERATREYQEAIRAVERATSDVWDDWNACREKAAYHQKIRDTLAEYLRLTVGNEDLARTFLEKAFPAVDVSDALGPRPAGAAEAA